MKHEHWTFDRKALVTLRSFKGLNQEAFGRIIGRSGQSVRNWELGKQTPTAKDLSVIANVFDITPSSFFIRPLSNDKKVA